jgi:hypothetical protein
VTDRADGRASARKAGPPVRPRLAHRPYGAAADRRSRSAARLRDQLIAAEFRARTEEGERLDGHQVIDLALDAIASASARA